MNYTIKTITVFSWLTVIWACSQFLPSAPKSEDVLAEPMEGLTNAQLRSHLEGDGQFDKIFSMEEGLGPAFVSNSCQSCHIGDGKGHPLTTLTRFGKYNNSVWDPMIAEGGPQLQDRAIAGFPAEKIPQGATGVAQFTPPAVSGLGFMAAVTDADILALADPGDADGDGISGTVNYIQPPDYFIAKATHIPNNGKYIGRFGKKAGAIDLTHQIVSAYIQDMGITSDFVPQDLYNPEVGVVTGGDMVEDPEVSAAIVNNVVFYIRTLKAPPRRDKNASDVLAGEQLFMQTDCAKCHMPTLTTATSDVEVLSEKTFYPFTDMLMHDMGAGLDDGYTEGTAQTSEWRTAPLWGIGLAKDSQGGSLFLMHDGRASSLGEAIELHGGEALVSRNKFKALSATEKDRLIRFLESL